MRKIWYWWHQVPILLLGMASGLPLALVGSTLQAWYTDSGADLKTIGALTLVGLPYVLKPLWSPFFDRFRVAWLGRRCGWLALIQVLSAMVLVWMSQLSPIQSPHLLALVACFMAFLSASMDIVYDAWRIDLLAPEERGLGAACATAGYRTGMLLSGGLALIFAEHVGWEWIYLSMAALTAALTVVTLLAPEPVGPSHTPATLMDAVVMPIVSFLKHPRVYGVLSFVILYKLGDAFALSLSTTFLLRQMHFTLADVGWLYKSVGMAATIFGAFVGGMYQPRIGLYKALWYFGVLQALSNLMYAGLLLVGKQYSMLVGTIFIENFCAGMGTAVLVAFLMSLCDRRYSATQYALLTAFASLGRVFIGPVAAYAIEHTSWMFFFVESVLICLPGFWVLWSLRAHPVFRVMDEV